MSGGGTLIAALQIGYKMGIRKFYLYGVDHNFSYRNNDDGSANDAQGEGNHFIKNYRSGKSWQAPRKELIEESFVKCEQILRAEGGGLLNATNGGELDVLKRCDFSKILDSNCSVSPRYGIEV